VSQNKNWELLIFPDAA